MNTRIVILLFLSWAGWKTGFAQENTPRFSASDVKADFEFLYKTLAAASYNLYANTPKKTFDEAFNRIHQSIQDSLTPLQINRLFQPFVALAKLGHCVTGYPFRSYNAFLATGGRVFPFDVRVDKHRLFVTGNHSRDTTIRKGDEILTINGETVPLRLAGLYTYLSGENDYFKNTLIDLVGFPRLYWMVYDNSTSFSIKVKKRNGQVILVDDQGILASDYKNIRNQQPPLFNTKRDVHFVGTIAYIHPGQFVNSESSGNTSSQQTFGKGEFVHFIDSAFVQIHHRKANQLIIDLRGNPGGDNTFSDYMLAYFATRPFSFNSAFSVKTSPVTKQFWAQVADSSLTELKNSILSKRDGERFAVKTKRYSPRTDSLRFRGTVYVLIDRYTYSNAATTAAQIQDYKFGVLLGEPTAESPTLYASVHEFELPHTRISVTYPKAFMVRPNGDKSLKGVTPNVLAADDAFTPADELFNFAIRYIQASNK